VAADIEEAEVTETDLDDFVTAVPPSPPHRVDVDHDLVWRHELGGAGPAGPETIFAEVVRLREHAADE